MGAPLVALVVAAAVAASNPPAPSAPVSSAEQKHKPEQHSSATNNTERPGAPAVVVNVGTGQGAHIQTGGKAESEHKDSSAEWWIAGATIALAGITTALAVFTALLWGATKGLIKSAEESAKKQLRAYVAIDAMEIRDFAAGGIAEVVYTVKNFGNTPARDAQIKTCMNILKEWQEFAFTSPPRHGGIPQGSWLNGTSAFINPLSDAEFMNVVSGESAIWIDGRIDYVDIFGMPHSTEFRRYWRGSGGVPIGPLALATDPNGEKAT